MEATFANACSYPWILVASVVWLIVKNADVNPSM